MYSILLCTGRDSRGLDGLCCILADCIRLGNAAHGRVLSISSDPLWDYNIRLLLGTCSEEPRGRPLLRTIGNGKTFADNGGDGASISP